MKEEMEINGEIWVKKNTNTDGLKYCVARTYSAGVYSGYVKEKKGKDAILTNARMIYSWKGALSTLEIANNGVDLSNSKITEIVPEIELSEVIAIIKCSEKAKNLLLGAKSWKQ